jgi:hypothetical protein
VRLDGRCQIRQERAEPIEINGICIGSNYTVRENLLAIVRFRVKVVLVIERLAADGSTFESHLKEVLDFRFLGTVDERRRYHVQIPNDVSKRLQAAQRLASNLLDDASNVGCSGIVVIEDDDRVFFAGGCELRGFPFVCSYDLT